MQQARQDDTVGHQRREPGAAARAPPEPPGLPGAPGLQAARRQRRPPATADPDHRLDVLQRPAGHRWLGRDRRPEGPGDPAAGLHRLRGAAQDQRARGPEQSVGVADLVAEFRVLLLPGERVLPGRPGRPQAAPAGADTPGAHEGPREREGDVEAHLGAELRLQAFLSSDSKGPRLRWQFFLLDGTKRPVSVNHFDIGGLPCSF
mmetsp:Transcript_51171/g.132002  ORF Transcript_51171/g.132002 Transcript_51171/m.132002 type:complete len:204 (+) Transcript_51171:1804-2415(+)